MTIDKAIEILDDYERFGAECTHPDLPDAIKLGIEALDYIRRHRQANPGVAYTVLKGEEVSPC